MSVFYIQSMFHASECRDKLVLLVVAVVVFLFDV